MCYFNSGFMNIARKKCFEIVNVSKDCTDDKLHKTYHELVTKYCLQLGQEVYVIKITYSTLFQSTWGKGFKMCCYHNSQWLHKNCRKKLILNNWNPIKRSKQECMMNCLKNIFWTIYKGLFTVERGNVSSQEFFFLNIEHSISYIILKKIIHKILL